MPQNTGVKNRINYFERLVKEDAKFAVNDEKYGEYLKSLGTLVGLTNEIYGENDGKLDKEKYEALVRQYLDVMQKSIDYKEKSTDKTRMSIVNYIQKVSNFIFTILMKIIIHSSFGENIFSITKTNPKTWKPRNCYVYISFSFGFRKILLSSPSSISHFISPSILYTY